MFEYVSPARVNIAHQKAKSISLEPRVGAFATHGWWLLRELPPLRHERFGIICKLQLRKPRRRFERLQFQVITFDNTSLRDATVLRVSARNASA